MYRLSSLILILFGFIQSYGQSPHGDLFKTDCASCHDPNGWLPLIDSLQFEHGLTNFPLEGTHRSVDCRGCHTSLVFADAPSECARCHTDIHSMSVGNDCARCHTPQNWLVDVIPELHEESGFPLVGVHNSTSCVECHLSETNLRFDRIGNDCINCHRDEYLATQNPNHQKASFSTDCIECHDPFGFAWNANILHDFFPLVQGHDIQDCRQCHLTDSYTDASPDCTSCHLDDYIATTNPNHSETNFSTNCADCHNIGAWAPADFDHDSFYQLLGAHAIIATNCTLCHVDGNYTNTPNTCVGCHQTDYNTTSDPNHSAAKFPTDCTQCHNETAWSPSDFDHDGRYFPIYSGRHRGEWTSCTECHINSSNYAVFSCLNCHEHSNRTEVNNDHNEVSGYRYESNACLACHPTGNGD